MASSWVVHHKWKVLSRDRDANGDFIPVTAHDEQWLLRKIQTRFFGWVLTTTSTIVSKARKQLFYHTFIARYHGLSREGSETLSQFGLTMRKTSYDSTRKDVVAMSRSKTEEVGFISKARKYYVHNNYEPPT
jgi:hypothetical protein